MHATIRRYEGVDQNRTVELTRKVNETLVPQLSKLQGFKGYYMIESGNGVFSSLGLFENPSRSRSRPSSPPAGSATRSSRPRSRTRPRSRAGRSSPRATASPSPNGPTKTRSPAKGLLEPGGSPVTSDRLAAEPVREARAPGLLFRGSAPPAHNRPRTRRVDFGVCDGGMGVQPVEGPLGLAAQLGSVVCGALVRLARWRSARVGA